MTACVFCDVVSNDSAEEDKEKKVVIEIQPNVEHCYCSKSSNCKRCMDAAVQVEVEKPFGRFGDLANHSFKIRGITHLKEW